ADLRRVEPAPPLRDTGGRPAVPSRAPTAPRATRLPSPGLVNRQRFESGPLPVHEERSTLPLGTFCGAVPGGPSGGDPADCGATGLMKATLVKGTPMRDARRVAIEVDGLGTAIERIVDEDYFGFSMSLLARHAQRGFETLLDLVRHPAFVYEEIEKERA